MPHNGLHLFDYLVIAAYFATMLGVGFYFMRGQKTASEYLLASHEIGWFAIGLSLLSSLNSAMDYIVGPAAYIEWGMILGAGFISVILAFPFVFSILIPFYQKLNIFNCYEYLESRFDIRVRTTASVIFILWRICWMAFTIYLPAYALNIVMGLPELPTVIFLGVFATFYTTIGGARTVIWTDVIQAIIMLVGLVLAVIIAVRGVPNGFAGVWESANNANLLKPTATIPGWEAAGFWEKVSLYFHFPITLGSIIISNFIVQLSNYGADQVMVQRYLSAKSLRDCQLGFIANALAYIFYVVVFFTLSMTLLAFFEAHPVPPEFAPKTGKFDFLFPYFIGTQLPPILKGMVLIAIYSAAQSSLSAGISAGTSVIYSNIYSRLWLGQLTVPTNSTAESERQGMVFNRLCALGFGIAVTIVGCGIPYVGTSLFEIANKIVANFAGVMIPVFLLGMFSRRAKSLGTSIGAVCGVLAMFTWGFGHQWGLFENELGYGWTMLVGFITTIVVAQIISIFEKDPPPEKLQYLWREVMAR
jgi:SSS family solute:Na+ symporter